MIDLQNLGGLLKHAFAESEAVVRRDAGLRLPKAQETELTALFVVEVGRQLEAASNEGRVARAVHEDLARALAAFGAAPPTSLSEITNGLIARVSRHTLAEEARTGGDFGLLFIEPVFRFRWGSQFDIERGGHRRGLLVQAKRRLPGGAWNPLTERQKKMLPSRMSFAALLRYEFEESSKSQLKAFRWNILAGAEVAHLIAWLRSGEFPESRSTAEVVGGLSAGAFGTDNRSTIEADICNEAAPSITVHVDWRDGEYPGFALARLNRELSSPTSVQEQIRLKQ